MSKLVLKVKALVATIKNWIREEEHQLPVGITEFHAWSDRIIAKVGPIANEDSLKYALATMIIHAEHSMAKFTDTYFISRLRKSAANQVASQIFQDIKARQEEAAKVVDAAKQAVTQVEDAAHAAQEEYTAKTT